VKEKRLSRTSSAFYCPSNNHYPARTSTPSQKALRFYSRTISTRAIAGELQNIIEHAVVLAEGNEIVERDLPEFMFRNVCSFRNRHPPGLYRLKEIRSLSEVERDISPMCEGTSYNYTESIQKTPASQRSTFGVK